MSVTRKSKTSNPSSQDKFPQYDSANPSNIETDDGSEECAVLIKLGTVLLNDVGLEGERKLVLIPRSDNILLTKGLTNGMTLYDKSLNVLKNVLLDFQNYDPLWINTYFRNSSEAFVPISDRFYLVFMIDSCVLLFDSYNDQIYKFFQLGKSTGFYHELCHSQHPTMTIFRRKKVYNQSSLGDQI